MRTARDLIAVRKRTGSDRPGYPPLPLSPAPRVRRRSTARRLGRFITVFERRVSCVCVIKSAVGAVVEVTANLIEAAFDASISDLGRIHVHRQRIPSLVDHPIRLTVFPTVADGSQRSSESYRPLLRREAVSCS